MKKGEKVKEVNSREGQLL